MSNFTVLGFRFCGEGGPAIGPWSTEQLSSASSRHMTQLPYVKSDLPGSYRDPGFRADPHICQLGLPVRVERRARGANGPKPFQLEVVPRRVPHRLELLQVLSAGAKESPPCALKLAHAAFRSSPVWKTVSPLLHSLTIPSTELHSGQNRAAESAARHFVSLGFC